MSVNTLVITGGTNGIGKALVDGFAAKGYQVVFNGMRSIERLDPALQSLSNSVYVSGDAGNPQTATKMRQAAHEKFGADLGRLVVVANAGIEKPDTDKEGVEQMKKVNAEGPEHLLREFRDLLVSRPEENLFIGVSSIVASLNVILPGNTAYHATKVEVERLVETAQSLFPSVPAIVLSPGAIRTSMTDSSVVYGILLRMAAIVAAGGDQELHGTLATLLPAGENGLGSTPAEIFLNLLGAAALEKAPVAKTLKAVLAKDPIMKDMKAQLLAAKAAQDDTLKVRMAEILTAADILVSPEIVARIVMEEITTRRILREGGVLTAWQAGNATPAPIARLFTAANAG